MTGFTSDVLFQIILSSQVEHHLTFTLFARPSHDLRSKYRKPSGGALHFAPVPFDFPNHEEEHLTGNLAHDACDRCEGAGQ